MLKNCSKSVLTESAEQVQEKKKIGEYFIILKNTKKSCINFKYNST